MDTEMKTYSVTITYRGQRPTSFFLPSNDEMPNAMAMAQMQKWQYRENIKRFGGAIIQIDDFPPDDPHHSTTWCKLHVSVSM